MVFPSVPVYLDPLNWPQQQTYQQSGVGAQNSQRSNPPQPPPSTVVVGGGGQQHQGSGRPGSMADRARLAKIQPPEAALKCPRCESTNTKFCYYNNYSLLQPRHFCKTCRRYWTRGGAMRNVPVGGGCRRNKRSKGSSSRSKSPIKDDPQASSSCSARANSSSTCTTNAIGHLPTLAPSQMPLFPTSHHYNDYFSKGMGLHFGAIPPPVVVANSNTASSIGFEFQIGTSSGANNCDSVLPNGLIEQWRLPNQQVHQQQFPFLSDLETQAQIGLFQFEGENIDEQLSYVDRSRLRSKTLDSDSSVREMPHQVSSVRKVDENQGFSLSKNLLGSSGNDQFWAASGNTWNNIPSFTSSTSHLL